MKLIDWAIEYVERGLAVIALTGKMPNGAVHPHGIYDAFEKGEGKDPAAFFSAFMRPQTTGVGILTGTPFFVVDIDGEDGARQWLDIVGEQDYLPDSWCVKTGRGLHLYYADWTPRKTRKLGAKLDLKGVGGYVCAPPSVHPDGGTYQWLMPPTADMQEAPGGLTRLLDKMDALAEQSAVTKDHRSTIKHKAIEDGKIWNTVDFGGVYAAMRNSEEGNRNHVLYWGACVLTEDGGDEEDFMQLREAAAAAGLTNRETKLTIQSAVRRLRGG
jgi:hypothetical protein